MDDVDARRQPPARTALQRHWIDVREAVELALRQADEETLEVLLDLLVILAARLARERLEREWRRAA
jgi:hypothetical protein